MATKIYLEGAFVLIEINTQKTRIPKSSFVFNFVGETDTVRFRSVEASFQPISEIWTNVQDQTGAPAGTTKEEVETYLSGLPSSGGGGTTGGALESTQLEVKEAVESINNKDFALNSELVNVKNELTTIKTDLKALFDLIKSVTSNGGTVKAFSGNTEQQLPVAVGTIGEITNISDYSAGSVNYEIDGVTNPVVSGVSPRVTGTSASFGIVNNIDLSKVRFKGTSNGSDYSVTYNIYKTV